MALPALGPVLSSSPLSHSTGRASIRRRLLPPRCRLRSGSLSSYLHRDSSLLLIPSALSSNSPSLGWFLAAINTHMFSFLKNKWTNEPPFWSLISLQLSPCIFFHKKTSWKSCPPFPFVISSSFLNPLHNGSSLHDWSKVLSRWKYVWLIEWNWIPQVAFDFK